MANVYRGIDIAGDGSPTGLADLVQHGDRLFARISESGFCEYPGMRELLQVDAGEILVGCAIDQPLGFPTRTMRLLCLEGLAGPAQHEYSPLFSRYRKADLAMHATLKAYGLNPNYVLSPVVCDNIWRALFLLAMARENIEEIRQGKSAWCETHPRLSVADLVPMDRRDLVRQYKYKGPVQGTPEERKQTKKWHSLQKETGRAACLDLLIGRLPFLVLDRTSRDRAISDDHAFEALFCAVASFAKARHRVKRFPTDDLQASEAKVEGYVFVPDWPSLTL